MGVAHVKTRINHNDSRVKEGGVKKKIRKEDKDKAVLRESTQAHSSLFFQCNTSLKPPYQVLLDTNFINMSIQMKLDVFQASMECLLAKTVPCITDCVMAELEKMGSRYRLALRLAKDPRFHRLTCCHKGTYADDCLCERVEQ